MAVPQNLVAAFDVFGEPLQVALTWDAFAGATSYDIERNGVVMVFGHLTNSYTDTDIAPGVSYVYRVRAEYDGSLPDVFTDTFLETF